MNAIDSAWVVLKGSRDREWGAQWMDDRKTRVPIPIAGGVPEGASWMKDPEDTYGEIPEDTSDMDDLASATREDLIDMLEEQVWQMSHEELIQLLVSTKGSLSTTFNTTGGA